MIVCAVFVGVAQDPASTTAARAQAENLPEILRPSDYAIDRAKEMGGEVFKMLPLEMNHPAMKGFNNGSMARGVLNETFSEYSMRSGTGTYYKFTKGPYRPPLIKIGFSYGELTVGNGHGYGFYTDLGERDLRTVDKTLPEAHYFLSYKPPRMKSDIPGEIRRLKKFTIGGSTLMSRVPVKVGHTYLLRSIDFWLIDMAVVLHVLEAAPDGAITIVWKRLAEFEPPPSLFMPDAELQKLVDAVLAELQVRDLQVTVKDNILIFTGVDKNFERVKAALLERKIPQTGIGYKMKRSIN